MWDFRVAVKVEGCMEGYLGVEVLSLRRLLGGSSRPFGSDSSFSRLVSFRADQRNAVSFCSRWAKSIMASCCRERPRRQSPSRMRSMMWDLSFPDERRSS